MYNNFEIFLSERVRLSQELHIKDQHQMIMATAKFVTAASSMASSSSYVNEMLRVLYESAVNNNDHAALEKVEVLSSKMLDILDGTD